MVRTDSRIRGGDGRMHSVVYERERNDANERIGHEYATHRRDALSAIVVPASNLVLMCVRHRLSHSHVEGSSPAEAIINRSEDPNLCAYPERAADGSRPRLNIRFRKAWRIQISLPKWCGGFFSGIIRVRI